MKTKKTIMRRLTAAGWMLAAAVMFITAGCKGNIGKYESQTKVDENSTWYKDTAALEALYQKAVDDAKEPTPSKVVDTLSSITNAKDNPDQEWIKVGDTDMVLVASLMKDKFVQMYKNEKDTFRLASNESWFTIPAEWQKKAGCFAGMDSVESRTRLLQMLGLPLSTVHTEIVAVYVDAKALFRPSHDPEITDHTSQLTYPSGVSRNHHDWFEYNVSFSYEPGNAYPWTQLGYTYDWHNPDGYHVGLSEFVAFKGTLAKVKEIKSCWQFIQELQGKN